MQNFRNLVRRPILAPRFWKPTLDLHCWSAYAGQIVCWSLYLKDYFLLTRSSSSASVCDEPYWSTLSEHRHGFGRPTIRRGRMGSKLWACRMAPSLFALPFGFKTLAYASAESTGFIARQSCLVLDCTRLLDNLKNLLLFVLFWLNIPLGWRSYQAPNGAERHWNKIRITGAQRDQVGKGCPWWPCGNSLHKGIQRVNFSCLLFSFWRKRIPDHI